MSDEDGGIGLEIFAKLNLAIGELTKSLKKQQQDEQRRLARLPIYTPRSLMSQPLGTTDLQDFGGPQPGRSWVIRLLSALASPIGPNAAIVTWYVGQIMPGPGAGQLPATTARWQFPSVPAFQNFTSEVIKIYPGEHLIAGLTNVPASSSIALNVAFNDQPLYAQHAAIAVE